MPRPRGGRRIRRNLQRIRKNAVDAVNASLEESGADLLGRSNDLAPQETGELIASGEVVTVPTPSGIFAVGVVYSAKHALPQHEGFFNPGPITRAKPGAGRKYLSRALAANQARYLDDAAEAALRAIRQSTR